MNLTSFDDVLCRLSTNQREDGYELFREAMTAQAEELRQHEALLRREVARLRDLVGNDPEDAYTHPTVIAAARRLEKETGNLLIGPALGWMLHAELDGRRQALLPNPLTGRLLPL